MRSSRNWQNWTISFTVVAIFLVPKSIAIGRSNVTSSNSQIRTRDHGYMISVDTNVFMYAVGKEHSLQAQATEFDRMAVLNRDSTMHFR